ncbi:uncharacterized protein LOC113774164 [Coffea eugenioides]|uniref:uncharacterized protein LOC113774164 n=1 Tax=Coffea eugenioides TaxID=49369 RepID=UPI000F614447|nr:uncharacterized protein LOC113774164 [Coffea eugenioides]
MEHLFFSCENAAEVWKMAPVRWDGLQDKQHNLWLWWEQVTQALSLEQGQDRVNLTINILWQIWKARNKKVFEDANQEPFKILRKAQAEWLEFEQEREPEQEGIIIQTSSELNSKREMPRERVIRLYTDAAGKGIASKEEALAIRNALLMAKQAGWAKIIVYSDCKSVVKQTNKCSENDSNIATILEDVQDLRTGFDRCSFVFVPRTENEISHVLA